MIDDEDMNTGLDSCIEIRVVPESLLEFKKSKAIVIFLDNNLQPNNELSTKLHTDLPNSNFVFIIYT
jgi:hypothetical protein